MSYDEFPDDPLNLKRQPRLEVEQLAILSTSDIRRHAAARAELVRRDREYAEQQEESRRAFETRRDATRIDLDRALDNAEADRDVKRKVFEERLAERQMAHATAVAKEQVGAAQSAASAARWAAWATAAAALGAIAQAIIAALK